MRINDNTIALIMMNATADQVQSCMARPSAVPGAAGCSVLVTAIIKIPDPTSRAAMISSTYRDCSAEADIAGIVRIAAETEPVTIATAWPTITLRGVEAKLLAKAKIPNAAAATMAALSTASSTRWMIKREAVANPHCEKY